MGNPNTEIGMSPDQVRVATKLFLSLFDQQRGNQKPIMITVLRNEQAVTDICFGLLELYGRKPHRVGKFELMYDSNVKGGTLLEFSLMTHEEFSDKFGDDKRVDFNIGSL